MFTTEKFAKIELNFKCTCIYLPFPYSSCWDIESEKSQNKPKYVVSRPDSYLDFLNCACIHDLIVTDTLPGQIDLPVNVVNALSEGCNLVERQVENEQHLLRYGQSKRRYPNSSFNRTSLRLWWTSRCTLTCIKKAARSQPGYSSRTNGRIWNFSVRVLQRNVRQLDTVWKSKHPVSAAG